MNSATIIEADEQEAAAFLWALDRDSFAELCGAFARHREAERARIVAWLRVNGLPVACIKHAQVLIDADNFWSVVSAIEAGEHLK